MQERVAANGPLNRIQELRQAGIDLCMRGFYQEALSAFQKAIFLARDPETNAEVYCDIGVVFRCQNQLDMADEIFQFILDNDPLPRIRVIAYIEQAIVRLRKLDHQAALEKIASADEQNADDVILLTHLNSTYGRIYYALYEFDKALGKYNKALSFIEHNESASAIPVILNNIGDCHMQLGNHEQGESFILKALHIARDRKNNRCTTECLISLMDAAIRRKEFDKVKTHGKKALSIARSFKFTDLISEVEYRLADVYREEGNQKISDFFFNRVLESHRNLNTEVLTILAKTG